MDTDIVIGVNKSLLAEHMVKPLFPDCLMQHPHQIVGDYAYWSIKEWSWADGDLETQALLDLFNRLTVRCEEEYAPVFGAAVLFTTDDRVECWGTPYKYDIYDIRVLDSPYME